MSGYSAGGKENKEEVVVCVLGVWVVCVGGNRYFPLGTAVDTSAAALNRWVHYQVVKKCFEGIQREVG